MIFTYPKAGISTCGEKLTPMIVLLPVACELVAPGYVINASVGDE